MNDKINKKIESEILINKIDAEVLFTADAILAIRRAVAVEEKITEQLVNLGIERQGNLSCELTSIYKQLQFDVFPPASLKSALIARISNRSTFSCSAGSY